MVSAPGPASRAITFRTYLDGVLQDGTVTVMTVAEGDHSEVTHAFSVPTATQGQLWAPATVGQWTIDVSVLGYHAGTLTVTVQ